MVVPSKHSAAGSAAGYYYQARLALAEALKFAYSDLGIEIAIEKLDDVSFEKDGAPLELLQLKHHLQKVGDLSDTSSDLWKTIRIWSERVKLDPSLPSRIRFALITSGVASNGGAAACLRAEAGGATRNVEIAVTRLLQAATSSTNTALEPAFGAFVSLAPRNAKVDARRRGHPG